MSLRIATSSSPSAIRARRLLGLVTSFLPRRVVQELPDYMLSGGSTRRDRYTNNTLGCVRGRFWERAAGHPENGPTLTVDNVQLARRVLAKRADFDRLVRQFQST